MTKEEIRAMLKVEIRLNPKGTALKEGSRWWSGDGGNYNGYVTIPAKFAGYFPPDEDGYSENQNIPGISGGQTYSAKGKDGSLTVGFDTLHYNDTEAYWTEEQTLKETSEWADAIAEVIFKCEDDKDYQRSIPHMTVGQIRELLRFYDDNQKIEFSSFGSDGYEVLYKTLQEQWMTPEQILILSVCDPIPD